MAEDIVVVYDIMESCRMSAAYTALIAPLLADFTAYVGADCYRKKYYQKTHNVGTVSYKNGTALKRNLILLLASNNDLYFNLDINKAYLI